MGKYLVLEVGNFTDVRGNINNPLSKPPVVSGRNEKRATFFIFFIIRALDHRVKKTCLTH